MTLDDSSIAILGGEVPTSDGIAISAEMKTYNIDNGDWTSQPGKKRPAGTNFFHFLFFKCGYYSREYVYLYY